MTSPPLGVRPNLQCLARPAIEQFRHRERICGLEGRDGGVHLRRVGLGRAWKPRARDLHLGVERREEEDEGEGERDGEQDARRSHGAFL
jgi:hypothetical protein